MRGKFKRVAFAFAAALMLVPGITIPQAAHAATAQNGYFTVSYNQQSQQILQYGVFGSKPVTITTLAANKVIGDIVASHSGNTAAFIISDLISVNQNTTTTKPSGIAVINKDGTGLTDVTPSGYITSNTSALALHGWSSDDSRLLVQSYDSFANPAQWLSVAQKQLSGQLSGSLSSLYGKGTFFGTTGGKVFYFGSTYPTIDSRYICSSNENGTGESCNATFSIPGLTSAGALAVSGDGQWVVANIWQGSGSPSDAVLMRTDGTGQPILLNLGAKLAEYPGTGIAVATFASDGSLFFSTYSGNSSGEYVLGNDFSNITLSKIPVAFAGNYGTFAPQPGAIYAPNGYFTAVNPARITDTRTGSGYPNAGSRLATGGTLDIKVTGTGGVPTAGVSSVVVNLTATNGNANTHLTAYRKGDTRPATSNLNVAAGQVVNNQVTARVSSDGYISLFNAIGSIDAVVDIVGYYSGSGSSYVPQEARRLLDTRSGGVKVPAGGSVDVWIPAAKNITACVIKNDAVTAASIQLTVTNQVAAGYMTVVPTGSVSQGTSSLNYYAGQTITRMVTSAVGSRTCDGSAGKITIKNGGSAPVDAIVDLIGVYRSDRSHGVYMPINPERIFDNRYGIGTTVGKASAQVANNVKVSQQAFTSTARAVDINMVATDASGPTYLTASSSATFSPTNTYLTYNVWNPATNQGTVKLAGGSWFYVYNAVGTTSIVVDQFGYYY